MEMSEHERNSLNDIQRRYLMYPEGVSLEEREFREKYIETMLIEIDAALCSVSEVERAWFILFNGLSGEHGAWSYDRIAQWYAAEVIDIIKSIQETANRMPSPSHALFAKKYRELYI
ncbi:hypothetical protein KBC70_00060 [Candidatus Woesebacteria bacterium]|nr:hypothetical protein [Candidatus Woesebacteria bacterium]